MKWINNVLDVALGPRSQFFLGQAVSEKGSDNLMIVMAIDKSRKLTTPRITCQGTSTGTRFNKEFWEYELTTFDWHNYQKRVTQGSKMQPNIMETENS